MPITGSGIEYAVYVRDKNFSIIAQVDDFKELDYIARFNDVGEWTLTTSKASPFASVLVRGNGLIVSNAVTNAVLLSGPIRSDDRKGTNQADNLVVAGWDDMVFLKRRKALPITGAQTYYQNVKADAPKRWYRLGDPSGTTAHDWGSDAQDGTYNASPSLAQRGAVYYDTNAAVLFNGTSQYVTCPAGGSLPTGNSAWAIEAWIYLTGNPSGNAIVAAFGTQATHKMAVLYITSAGMLRAGTFGGDSTGGSALSLNTWHHVVASWDGTTIVPVLDGALYGSGATPGAMTTNASPPMAIGAFPGGGSYFPGTIGEVAVYNSAISLARIQAHYNAGVNATSKGLNQQQFDTQSSIQASTAIYHYVNNNLGPSAQIDRWPGYIYNYTRPSVTMTADPALGSTISTSARFDNLLNLCQLIATASTPELGFRLSQSAIGGSQTSYLTFTISAPSSKTNIVLEELTGTLGEYEYMRDESTDNFCTVGGSGSGTSRVFACSPDPTSLALFGRIEGLVNYSASSDATALAAVGTDEVNKSSNDHTITATPAEVTNMVFGVDYNLGDRITIVVDGDVVTDVVREAHLTLSPTDGAVWSPTIGSPSAQQANLMLKELLKEMRTNGAKIGLLDAVQ